MKNGVAPILVGEFGTVNGYKPNDSTPPGDYTDINSNVSATKDTTNGFIYGPYLRAVPPITVGESKGKNGIAVSTDPATAPTGGASDGWLFNAATGSLAPNATGNDSGGKPYSSY